MIVRESFIDYRVLYDHEPFLEGPPKSFRT